jgi:carbon storage regulator CsrA
MLTLTRKINQAVYIGDGIKVVLLGAERGRAKIGIEAPDGVYIVREELLENLLDAVNSEVPRHVLPRERK